LGKPIALKYAELPDHNLNNAFDAISENEKY